MPPDSRQASRSFRLVWAAHAASVLGDGLVLVALPLLVLQMTGSAALAALAAAPTTVAYGLLGLIAGPLVDRFASRTVLVAADAARAALFVVLTGLVLTGVATAWVILLVAVLAACGGVLFETAHVVYLQELLADDQFVGANARLEATSQTGAVVGPLLAGVVAAAFGVQVCLLLNAASFVVSLLLLTLVSPARAGHASGRLTVAALRSELREGLAHLWRHTVVRRITLLQTGVNFAVATETLVIFFASTALNGGPAAASIVVAAAAVGGVGGAAAAAWVGRYLAPPRAIAAATLLLAAALAGAAAAPTVVWLAVANAVVGAASVLATVHIRALRQAIVAPEMLARVTSAARTLAVAAYPLGALLAGLATDADGGDPRPAFGLAAVFMAICALRAAATTSSRRLSSEGLT